LIFFPPAMFVVFCLFACLSRVLANVFKPIGWLPGMCDVHAKAKIKPTPAPCYIWQIEQVDRRESENAPRSSAGE